MLNVPAQAFPAPGSQQRVSPSGRSKVALKPGRSLMDWIRLTKSGRDLTGLRGRLVEVTEEELRKHNTRADCWTCIRGMVYNVSPYMEFHPGGEEELMKAAGIDGTDLFDQVHRWVNYESMLKECLVGKMAIKGSTVHKAHSSPETPNGPVNGLPPSPPNVILEPPLPPPLAPPAPKDLRPRFDWFQTDSTVNIVVYTKRKIPSSGCAVVDLQGGTLRLEVFLGKFSYLLHLCLSQDVQELITIQSASAVGKLQVSLRKASSGKWAELGRPLDSHDSFLRRRDRAVFYRECVLVCKTDVTHNTRLFHFRLPAETHMRVPVGRHVYLRAVIQGEEVAKPYTPVDGTLMPDSPNSTDCNRSLFLMVKIYPEGVFTPHLDGLNIDGYALRCKARPSFLLALTFFAGKMELEGTVISLGKSAPSWAPVALVNRNQDLDGDSLSVSNPEGSFSLRPLREVTHLYLLAAGSGFTPMARLIRWALQELEWLRKAKLMFFNRQEEDILWCSELQHLSAKEERFQVEHVLSEPSEEWRGRSGRVEVSTLSDFLNKPDGSTCFVCVCGPAAYTDLVVELVLQLGFTEEEVHAFQG